MSQKESKTAADKAKKTAKARAKKKVAAKKKTEASQREKKAAKADLLPETGPVAASQPETAAAPVAATVREAKPEAKPLAETVREAKPVAETVIESATAATLLEQGPVSGQAAQKTIQFKGQLAERLPTAGAEADIYILHSPAGKRVLKLYRYGANPKQEVLEKIAEFSRACPQHVVIMHESGFDENSQCWYEIMEYAEHGSLAHCLSQGTAKNFAFEDVVRELCEAIAALQAADMVHRDIKPSNVLLRSLEPLDLILTDFGITSIMHDVSIRATARNFTPEYAPPEMDVASKAGDWWALGIILYEVLTGKTPFHGLEQSAIFVLLATKPVAIPADLDPHRQLLLKGLLTRDIDRRWRADQVQRWLAGESPEAWYDMEAAALSASGTQIPLTFQRREYDTLEQLALAMAASDEAWQDGARLLGKGYLTDMLKKRSQYDDALLVESLACADSNEYVFRFVHTFIKNLQPQQISYRGLALSAENALAALQNGSAPKNSPSRDFADKTLNSGWASMLLFLKTRSIPVQPLFESSLTRRSQNIEELTGVLACLLHPELFYWGAIPANVEQTVSYKLQNQLFTCTETTRAALAWACAGKVMTMQEWEEMGGGEIVLPQSIAGLLAEAKTYGEGIAELRKRKAKNALLRRSNLEESQYQNMVFTADDAEYDRQVKVLVWNYSPKVMEAIQAARKNMARIDPRKTEYSIFMRYLAYLETGKSEITDEDLAICKTMPQLLVAQKQTEESFYKAVTNNRDLSVLLSIAFTLLAVLIFCFLPDKFQIMSKTFLALVICLGLPFFAVGMNCLKKKDAADAKLKSCLQYIDKKSGNKFA